MSRKATRARASQSTRSLTLRECPSTRPRQQRMAMNVRRSNRSSTRSKSRPASLDAPENVLGLWLPTRATTAMSFVRGCASAASARRSRRSCARGASVAWVVRLSKKCLASNVSGPLPGYSASSVVWSSVGRDVPSTSRGSWTSQSPTCGLPSWFQHALVFPDRFIGCVMESPARLLLARQSNASHGEALSRRHHLG